MRWDGFCQFFLLLAFIWFGAMAMFGVYTLNQKVTVVSRPALEVSDNDCLTYTQALEAENSRLRRENDCLCEDNQGLRMVKESMKRYVATLEKNLRECNTKDD